MTIIRKANARHQAAASICQEGEAFRIEGVVVGQLVDVSESAGLLVDYAGNPAEKPLIAISTTSLGRESVGKRLALIFEDGDPVKPIIVGPIHEFVTANNDRSTIEDQPPANNASVDGERVILTADKEIVLRCGEASITLTRAGKILVRGAYLLSRSTGVNRIKGGSVQIN
jgi:hypothetical protein